MCSFSLKYRINQILQKNSPYPFLLLPCQQNLRHTNRIRPDPFHPTSYIQKLIRNCLHVGSVFAFGDFLLSFLFARVCIVPSMLLAKLFSLFVSRVHFCWPWSDYLEHCNQILVGMGLRAPF